jgi:hypothetical protein
MYVSRDDIQVELKQKKKNKVVMNKRMFEDKGSLLRRHPSK